MKVRFNEVGRDKRSWVADISKPSEQAIAREAKRGGGLMSREVDAEICDSAAGGIITVGGWRVVGTFTLEVAS